MSETTRVDLYRSCRVEQFPHGLMHDEKPVPGVLYPDFYPKTLKSGDVRGADVDLETKEGVEWVMPGGGTSLFDRSGVFTKSGWLSFEIPDGTPVPDSLVVKNTGYNKRFKATHYQIEAKEMMTKESMKGALDNFARSAIARSVELSRA